MASSYLTLKTQLFAKVAHLVLSERGLVALTPNEQPLTNSDVRLSPEFAPTFAHAMRVRVIYSLCDWWCGDTSTL